MINLKSLLRSVINEGFKNETLYLGYVLPNNYKVVAIRGRSSEDIDDLDHQTLIDKYPRIDYSESNPWRYRSDLNVVFWWHKIPTQVIKDELENWIQKTTRNINPSHVVLNPRGDITKVDSTKRNSAFRLAHGYD